MPQKEPPSRPADQPEGAVPRSTIADAPASPAPASSAPAAVAPDGPDRPDGPDALGRAAAQSSGNAHDAPASFEEVLRIADLIPGWLTSAQARRLWDEARRLGPDAHVVEIGSHRGRSTVVLAAAVQALGGTATLTAVDAFVEGDRYGGAATRQVLEANLEAAGVRDHVVIRTSRSQDLRARWTDPVDLVWVDGKHDYWTCTDDLRWAAFLPPGGRVLVHDAFSSIGVTLALLAHVLPSRTLRYLGREGSLATFEVAAPTGADRRRLLSELSWWGRNVVVKVLLRLRLGALARAMGHVGPYDPY